MAGAFDMFENNHLKPKKILITVFRGTSAEVLLKDADFPVLILPNDKIKDAEKFRTALQKEHFDYVFSFGQRPNIKNKVHIETIAKNGELLLETYFDCEALLKIFEQNGIPAKLSNNAGTSYCNSIYWNGMRHIAEQKLNCQMVFVHVPFEKNITDVDGFRKKILDTIETYIRI